MFPILFDTAVDKNASVESLLERQEEGGGGVGVEFMRKFMLVRTSSKGVTQWRVGVGKRHRRVKAPTRVSFFTWEKIHACENLIKRGYSMVSRCCMYSWRWTQDFKRARI